MSAHAAGRGAVPIQVIDGVEPLSDRFEPGHRASVPAALQQALFGAGGDPEAGTRPLSVFAVLDAAKIANLPEMLASSGLAHRCLFTGAAYDELHTVAPWLVELGPDDRFTGHLFTKGRAPWHLWDVEPGIFLCIEAMFDDMWQHLRRFTRVRDDKGGWVYWRFWEPGPMAVLLDAWQDKPDKLRAFCHVAACDAGMRVLCLDIDHGTALLAGAPDAAGTSRPNTAFVLDEDDRRILSNWRKRRFDTRLLSTLSDSYPQLGSADRAEAWAWLQSVIAAAEQAGIRLENALVDFAHAAFLLRADPVTHGATVQVFRDATLHQKDKARLARKAAETHRQAWR